MVGGLVPIRSWAQCLSPSFPHLLPPSHLLQRAQTACSSFSLPSSRPVLLLLSSLWPFLPTCSQVIFLHQKHAPIPPALNPSAAPLWMNPGLAVCHSQH